MVSGSEESAEVRRPTVLVPVLWASVGGVAASQAYLWHWSFAWLAVVALGIALAGAEDRRPGAGVASRLGSSGLVGLVFQFWVGVHCWGFLYYGVPLFAAVVLYSSASGALFGLLLGGRERAARVPFAVRAALAWTGVEYLRSLGPYGFPLFIGGTQAAGPPGSALALVGSVGLSGVMVGWGVAVGAFVTKRPRSAAKASRSMPAAIAWSAALVAVAAVGRWQPGLEAQGVPRTVSVVQGGLPNALYAISNVSTAAKALVEARYFSLTEDALATHGGLVFQPEDTLHRPVPYVAGRVTEALFSATGRPALPDSFVVGGALREVLVVSDYDERLETFNSALLFAADDPFTALDAVDKYMIVPISELGLGRGQTDPYLDAGGTSVGILICYESMYPRMGRRAGDADILAVMTNDAGFNLAPVATTHAVQALARAIETGRPLVRAAQSGISYLATHRGEVLERGDYFAHRTLTAQLQPMAGTTWFSRGGYWLGPLALLAALVMAATRRFSRRPSHSRVKKSPA